MRYSRLLWLFIVAVACGGCKQATPPPNAAKPVAVQPVQAPAQAPVIPPQPALQAKASPAHRKAKPAAKQKCSTGYDCTHVWSTYIP